MRLSFFSALLSIITSNAVIASETDKYSKNDAKALKEATVFNQIIAYNLGLRELEEEDVAPVTAKSESFLEVALHLQGSNLCLNINDRVRDGESDKLKIWNCKGNERQRFRVSLDDGTIRPIVSIMNTTLKKCLTLEGNEETGDAHNNAPITIKDCANGSTDADELMILKQRWQWVEDGNDQFNGRMRSQWRNEKCLKGHTEIGKTARVYNCRKRDAPVFWNMANLTITE